MKILTEQPRFLFVVVWNSLKTLQQTYKTYVKKDKYERFAKSIKWKGAEISEIHFFCWIHNRIVSSVDFAWTLEQKGGTLCFVDMAHINGYVVAAGDKKKASQPSWNWVLINGTGETKALDVDKYAVMHRVQIHARDLRIIDPNLSYPSTILGRERAIVLNLEVRIVPFVVVISECYYILFYFVFVFVFVYVCGGMLQHTKAIITSDEVSLLFVSFFHSRLYFLGFGVSRVHVGPWAVTELGRSWIHGWIRTQPSETIVLSLQNFGNYIDRHVPKLWKENFLY